MAVLPSEETEGAKVYMAREGLFNDLDAALHWHPDAEAAVTKSRTAATNSVRIEFFGKATHAGGTPWLGRSALHAAELFAHGINLMREHIEPTARIHYVFEKGAEAPNVVPDYARIRLFVRDIDRTHVEASTAWIKQPWPRRRGWSLRSTPGCTICCPIVPWPSACNPTWNALVCRTTRQKSKPFQGSFRAPSESKRKAWPP
jgi:acetylornithine deacetylase/succinyl-diaminopimelate desuccinylase-like protein